MRSSKARFGVCLFFFFLFNEYMPLLFFPIPLAKLPCAEQCLSARMTELFIYKVERKTKFNTEILLKVLAKDSMKCCCLSDGGWQRTISVWHLARILQNVNAGMRS